MDADRRVVVGVHAIVRDLQGALLANDRLRHIYRIEDGLVQQMEIVKE
jgi:hypothetical protein